MAGDKPNWRNGPEAAQLRREMRDEAIRLRAELGEEFKRQMAQQMAEQLDRMREQGMQPRGHHHGGPRGRRASLSQEAIVTAAMKIMQTKGLSKVTMRSVAHELNTGPASLYVHVRSVSHLHGLMLDTLYGTLDLDGGQGDWIQKIKRLIGDATEVLLEHPELARSAVTARPVGEGSLRFANRMLELLSEGDIPRERAAWGVDLLLMYATASAAEHSADDDEDNATQQAFSEQLATGKFPHISAVSDVLFAGEEAERREWAIDAILAGLTRTPVPGHG